MKHVGRILPVAPANKPIDNFEGITYQEIIFLGAILSNQDSMNEYVSAWSIKEHMKRSGLNEISYNICMRKLLIKKFIETSVISDYHGNESNGVNITQDGNEWILKNEDKFSIEYQVEKEDGSARFELPFN